MSDKNKESPGGFTDSTVGNYVRQKGMKIGIIPDSRETIDANIQKSLGDLGKLVALNDIEKLPDGRVVLPYKQGEDLYVFVFSVKPLGSRDHYFLDPWMDDVRMDSFKNGKFTGNFNLSTSTSLEMALSPIFDKLIGPNPGVAAEGLTGSDKRSPRKNLLHEARRVSDMLVDNKGFLNGKHRVEDTRMETRTVLDGNFKNGKLDGQATKTTEGKNMLSDGVGNPKKIEEKGYFENGKLLNGEIVTTYWGLKNHTKEEYKDGKSVKRTTIGGK